MAGFTPARASARAPSDPAEDVAAPAPARFFPSDGTAFAEAARHLASRACATASGKLCWRAYSAFSQIDSSGPVSPAVFLRLPSVWPAVCAAVKLVCAAPQINPNESTSAPARPKTPTPIIPGGHLAKR